MTRQSIHDRIMSRQTPSEGEAGQSARPAPSARRWSRTVMLSLAAIVLVAIGVGAGVHHRQTLALFGVATAPDAVADHEGADDGAQGNNISAQEAAGESTPFARHVSEAGVTACSEMFAALGNMLTAGSAYGVQSFWNRQAPDANAMQALVGMSYETEDYAGPAAGYVFAAPDGRKCAGSMVRVAPYALPCEEVPAILPGDSERINALKQVAVYDLGDGGQALLLPMDASCVVISVASGARQSANQEGVRQ